MTWSKFLVAILICISIGSNYGIFNWLQVLVYMICSNAGSREWWVLGRGVTCGLWGFTCTSRCCDRCGLSNWGRHDFCDKWCCFANRGPILYSWFHWASGIAGYEIAVPAFLVYVICPWNNCPDTFFSWLLLQIDAAINSGNSGGPAFNDKGNCVGIAFQSLKHEDVENIGYVIPTPVIMHFIQDYEKNGAYTGNLVTALS